MCGVLCDSVLMCADRVIVLMCVDGLRSAPAAKA
jgi:hypothetical protein